MASVEDALKLIECGIAITPVAPKNKYPIMKPSAKGAGDGGFAYAVTTAEEAQRIWQRNPDANLGIPAAAGGLVIIDLDYHPNDKYPKDGFKTLAKWEEAHGKLPETVMDDTPTGGRHIYYRITDDHKDEKLQTQNASDGVDIRYNGGGVVCPPSIHPNGGTYKWVDGHSPFDIDIADLDENAYKFILSVLEPTAQSTDKAKQSGGFKPMELPDEIHEGEGRDNAMFKLAAWCRQANMSYNDALLFVQVKNKAICKPPMTDQEIKQKVDSAFGRYNAGKNGGSGKFKVMYRELKDGSKQRIFKHDYYAAYMLEYRFACYIDGVPAVWNVDTKRYEIGYDAWNRCIVDMDRECTENNRKEIKNYLAIVAPRYDSADADLIAFNNGVLSLDAFTKCNFELREMTPEDHIMQVIPHDFAVGAQSKFLANWLNEVSCGNSDILNAIIEVFALSIYRESGKLAKFPWLYGPKGANGKTTLMKLLGYVIGEENVAHFNDLPEILERFRAQEFALKLACVIDDCSSEYIDSKGVTLIKTLATGSWLTSDVKSEKPITFKTVMTTLVCSSNDLPRFKMDKGMERRFRGVTFNADFSGAKADVDIDHKLHTEEVAQSMLYTAVIHLAQLKMNGWHLPENDQTRVVLEALKVENDTVLQWIEDDLIERKSLLGMQPSFAYGKYKDYAENNGIKPVSQKRWSRTVYEMWGLHSKTCTQGGKKLRLIAEIKN